jgi:hypothetical protein
MAFVPGSSPPQGRPVPSWAVTEPDVTEALAALETYKKKDPSKGSCLRDNATHDFWLVH